MNCIRIALSTSTDTSRYSKLKKLNLAWCGCRFNSTLASKFWRIYPTHCHFVFDFLVQNLLRNCIPLVSQWDVTWCTKFHRILMCCGTNSGAAVPCHKGQCWDALSQGLVMEAIWTQNHAFRWTRKSISKICNVYAYTYTIRNYMYLNLDKFIRSKLRYSIQAYLL